MKLALTLMGRELIAIEYDPTEYIVISNDDIDTEIVETERFGF